MRIRRSILWAFVLGLILLTGPTFAPQAMASGPSETACAAAPSNAACDGANLADAFDGICWVDSGTSHDSYVVNERYGDPVDWNFPAPNSSWKVVTQLYYSPNCKTNWAVTYLNGGEDCSASNPPVWSTKVRRVAGPDGGYEMWHAAWNTGCDPGPYGSGVAISPMVYAPDNAAQACTSLSSDDQIKCTLDF